MVKFPTSTKEPFEKVHVKEGFYPARFKEVREDIKAGKFGSRVAFIFEASIDGKPTELVFITYSDKPATANNKLGEFITAFGGVIDGSEIDVDKYIGKMANIFVEDYKYTARDKEGKEVEKLASIITKVKPITEKV